MRMFMFTAWRIFIPCWWRSKWYLRLFTWPIVVLYPAFHPLFMHIINLPEDTSQPECRL